MLWILPIAYVIIELLGAYLQMQSALRVVRPELEDTARVLRAIRRRTLWQISAPLLRSSSGVATGCFMFVSVVRELLAAVILFTSQTKVMSVRIFHLKKSGDLGAIAVLGLAMLLLIFAVVIAVKRIPGLGGLRLRLRYN